MSERAEPQGAHIRPNAFAHLAHFSARHCIAVAAAFIFLAAMALGFAFARLDGDLERRPSIAVTPSIDKVQRELDRAFSGLDTTIVAGVEAADPWVARREALAAADQLMKSGQFSSAFVPGTGPFYETYGFLFLETGNISDRVNRALALKPLFKALSGAPDLAGLGALTAGVARLLEQGQGLAGIEELLLKAAATARSVAEGKPQPLPWTELAGLKAEPNSTRWFVIAEPAQGLAAQARAAAGRLSSSEAKVSWIFPAGQTPAIDGFVQSYGVPAAIALLLFMIMGGLTLGGPARFIAVMLAVITSVSFGAGVAALRHPDLDATTWTFAFAGGVPALVFSTVMVTALAEARGRGLRKTAALAAVAQLRGPTLLALGAVTLVFWLAWLPGALGDMADLAVTAAISVVAGILSALMVVPAVVAVFEETTQEIQPHGLDQLLAEPPAFHWNRARQIVAVVLIAAAIFCAVFVPSIEFGDGPLQAIDASPDTPAAAGAVHVLSPPGEPAHRLIERIGQLPETGAIRWIEQFLPLDVPPKQQSLGSLAEYLPAATGMHTTPSGESLQTLQANLQMLANVDQANAELRNAARVLSRSLLPFATEPGAERLPALEQALFAGFGGLRTTAEALSRLPAPSIPEIDQNLRRRFVDAEGRWRIEVMPKPGVSPIGFARALRKFGAAGPPIVSLDRAQSYRRAAILALLPSFGIASVIALFLLRRVDDWVAILLPLLMTLSLSAAMLRALGVTVSATVLSAATITLALSLCSTVMLGLRLRFSHQDPYSTGLRAALAPPLLCLALTAPLTLSNREAVAEFGTAMTVFLGTATIVNFAMVQQIFAWLGKRPG